MAFGHERNTNAMIYIMAVAPQKHAAYLTPHAVDPARGPRRQLRKALHQVLSRSPDVGEQVQALNLVNYFPREDSPDGVTHPSATRARSDLYLVNTRQQQHCTSDSKKEQVQQTVQPPKLHQYPVFSATHVLNWRYVWPGRSSLLW